MAQSGMQPGMQPMYQQQTPAGKPPVDYLRPLASDFLLAIGAAVALFLMMIGAIIAGLADSGGVRDLGYVLKSFGTFVISTILLFASIIRLDMDKLIRFGFILAAAVIIVFVGFW